MNLDYPGGQILITKVHKRKGSWPERYSVTGFENGGRGASSKECGCLLEAGKSKESRLSPGVSRKE